LFFGAMFFVLPTVAGNKVRVINNTHLTTKVGIELPIYSHLDAKIKPIKSQQELQDLLHKAILANSTQDIMQVVQAGADVNLFKDGKAPLVWATILKKYNAVEVLKKCGAISPSPENMLYRAILNDSPKEIRDAVQAGADVNHEINNKHPLCWAVVLTKSKAVEALLECGANKNTSCSGQMLVNQATIGRSTEPWSPNGCPCVQYGSLKLVQCAILLGDIKTALILIRHGADYKCNVFLGCDLLEYVLQYIDPVGIEDMILELIQELFNNGYPVNSQFVRSQIINNEITQRPSVWVAAIRSPFTSTKVLELFMKNGANPNQDIREGLDTRTPLLLAIQENNLRFVQYLLDAGADINKLVFQSDRTGQIQRQSPLLYAKSLNSDNQEIINLLVRQGAMPRPA